MQTIPTRARRTLRRAEPGRAGPRRASPRSCSAAEEGSLGNFLVETAALIVRRVNICINLGYLSLRAANDMPCGEVVAV